MPSDGKGNTGLVLPLMKLVLSGRQKISMKTIDKIIWGFNKSYEDDKLE